MKGCSTGQNFECMLGFHCELRSVKFRGCSILIFQKIPIMLKYNVYLRIQSEVARKQKRAYKMSKTFGMTISRLRFSELSLSDHNYFRPTRARGPRSTTTSHILKRSPYFAIISVDSTVAVPILSSQSLPIRYFCADSVILCSARARVNDSCACCEKS